MRSKDLLTEIKSILEKKNVENNNSYKFQVGDKISCIRPQRNKRVRETGVIRGTKGQRIVIVEFLNSGEYQELHRRNIV